MEANDDVVINNVGLAEPPAKTDARNYHGHANAMLVLAFVKGGKVYGDWSGLSNDKLYEGRDLDVTTDFRDVFGEVAYKHLGNKNLDKIFPNYSVNKNKFKKFLS